MTLTRVPAKWIYFVEKDSRQIYFFEQIRAAKVFNFGGICSSRHARIPNRARVLS